MATKFDTTPTTEGLVAIAARMGWTREQLAWYYVPTDLAGGIMAQIREAETSLGITLTSADDPAEDDEDEDE